MTEEIYSTEQKRIVKKLRNARLKKGLGQEDVAKTLRRSQSFVSKIESGQKKIDVILLKKLAKIYGLKINTLLD